MTIYHVVEGRWAVNSPFVGRWKLVDDKGVTSSYLTVTFSFGAKRDHAPAPGAWEVVGNEGRFTWGDGFRDIMRLEVDGKISFLGLGRETTRWDSPPLFRLQAIRIPPEAGPVVDDESYASLHRAGLVTRSPDGKTVSVRGYFRRDGTYVHPYTRAAPGQGAGKARSGGSRGRR